MTQVEKKQLETISSLLEEAGYDPYAQFCGYLKTGDETFITRRGNARQMISQMDKDTIKEFLEKMPESAKNSL